MKLTKFITLFIVTIQFDTLCVAQEDFVQEGDRQITQMLRIQKNRIDSLSAILLDHNADTMAVNCLNRLSAEYYIFNTDLAWHFARQAYDVAVKINFTSGMAEGLTNLGTILQERGNISGAENYFRRVPALYEHIQDRKAYARAIQKLSYCLKLELRFSEARALTEKNLAYYKSVNDETGMAYCYRLMGDSYHQQGYYEKAFSYFHQDMAISQERQEYKGSRRDQFMNGNLYFAKMYHEAGDWQTALSYYRVNAERAKANKLPDVFCSRLGDISFLTHQYDSARYYFELANHFISLRLKDSLIREVFTRETFVHIGETYLAQGQYNNALKYLTGPLKSCFPAFFFTMQVLYDVAQAYEGQHNYSEALHYTNQLINVAQKAGARQYLRDGFQLIWKIYDLMERKDSAYKYHLLYTAMNDSLASDVQLRNMAIAEMKVQNQLQESKIITLDNERKIQRQQNQLAFLSLGGVVLLFVLIYRNNLQKRRNEAHKRTQAENELLLQKMEMDRTTAELKRQAVELEMQALRAQMNPHFIFNSLNSINRFILQNNKVEASEYLTKFSRLVRMILQNSQASLIPLESELESLELYLNLESVRFNHHFSYEISVPKDLDISALQVPPLILQPYVENAIWHGLMHKEEKGDLRINVTEEDDFLCFTISDNGIGREKAAAIGKSATKHKSMGLRITAQRIAMLQKSETMASPVHINDLVHADGSAAGTEVTIKMPTIYENSSNG
jgi:tetratricopeptide (TPR) repeat protein